MFPAAFPAVGTFSDTQTSRCPLGIWIVFCSSRGASTKVAMRPETTCHSMWQWKSQTPGEGKVQSVLAQIYIK